METTKTKEKGMELGGLIYYTGDMANNCGWFRITAINSNSVDLEELPLGDDRDFRGILFTSIGDVYKGHCNPRFVTEDAFHSYRRQVLASVR